MLEMINASHGMGERPPRLLRGCIYGDPGAGKTTLAMLIMNALGGKTLELYTDSAWVAIDKFPEESALVHPIPYKGMSQIRGIIEAKDEGIEPWCNYDNLIWDTVARGTYNSTRELVKRKKFTDQRDPDISSWTHFNMIKDALADTLTALNQSQFNVIYLSHVKEPSDDDRKKKRFSIRPNLPWESYNLLAQEVALVGWAYRDSDTKNRYIQFDGTTTETAKSQIPTIEETTYLQNDVPELIKKWKEL